MVTLVCVVKLARKFEISEQRVFIDRERSSYNLLQSITGSIDLESFLGKLAGWIAVFAFVVRVRNVLH